MAGRIVVPGTPPASPSPKEKLSNVIFDLPIQLLQAVSFHEMG
jgi:hypothetical protein